MADEETAGGGKQGAAEEPAAKPAEAPRGRIARLRLFLKKHGHKFWWLHSLWALSLGIFVMLLARKGFEYLRWVAVALGGAWLLFLVFFRLYRSGARRKVEGTAAKVGFVAMTYLMKDMYQIMLFFLLPFYWNSCTVGETNFWFVVGLAVCALLSTLDVVFDNYVMRWRALASVLYLITVFGCLNLVVPVLLPWLPVSWTLLGAAGLSALVFLTLHFRLRFLVSRWGLVLTLVLVAAAMFGAYAGRKGIPPVPYYVQSAAAGVIVRADGRVLDAPAEIPAPDLPRVVAATDVALPAGGIEPFRHVWRREGREVARVEPEEVRLAGPPPAVRLTSRLPADRLPQERLGEWVVDVETSAGQLVGRADFEVGR
ncbi:MAG: DUF2914 domain-containing protein [Deltaproteobacteria bacterium]|nr:DUF2914 domain-containing protein [Deltaproteobacteria bacterium]